MKILLLILLCGCAFAATKVRYDNFKVYKATPINEVQIKALRDLEDFNNAFNFWSDVRGVNVPVHVMVPPHMENEFEEFAAGYSIKTEVWIDNVQERIDNEKAKAHPKSLGFTDYYELEEIYGWMDELSEKFSGIATLIAPGISYQGREIKGLHISFNAANENNAVFVEGGIHSREWISVATVCYMLNEVLNSPNSAFRATVERYDWYIFPVFNPDGYVHTHTTNRMWRKTRQPHGICVGADPNRNWEYRWNTGGASNNPCSESFAGPNPFSEPSTLSMSQYISSIQDKIAAYFSFHSFSQMLMWPYGHTTDHLDNHEETNVVAEKAVAALEARHGTQYTFGNIAETIYVATGSSLDWIKGTYGTRITYVWELRDLGQYGFLLPADQIIPTSEETMDSVIAILDGFDQKED